MSVHFHHLVEISTLSVTVEVRTQQRGDSQPDSYFNTNSSALLHIYLLYSEGKGNGYEFLCGEVCSLVKRHTTC
jgi:hypothetical protein